MPEVTDNDRRNVFTRIDGKFGPDYKKQMAAQRIKELENELSGGMQNSIAPEPPKVESINDGDRDTMLKDVSPKQKQQAVIEGLERAIGSIDSLPKKEEPVEAPKKEEDVEKNLLDSVGAFLKEIPGQVTGGIFDAVNNAVNTARDVGKAAGIPNYALQIKNEKGEFDLDILSPEEVAAKGGLQDGVLPEIDKAETTAGGFTRALATFAAGFLPAAKGLKAMGAASKIGSVGVGMAAGAVADGVVMDPHQDRLATLLNEVPVLKEIVPDYMADNDPANEGAWEGRFKNVLEGVVVGGAAEAIIGGATKMFRAYKATKLAPKVPLTPTQLIDQEAAAVAAKAGADDLINPIKEIDAVPEEILTKTPEGKTFVNHARIETSEDIHKVLQNMADEVDNTAKLANAESRAASVEEYKSITDLLGREAGRPFTASEAIAARDIMTSSADGLATLAKAASDPMAAPEVMFQFRRAVEVHRSIQETVLAGRKATARSLQSWNVSSTSSSIRAKQISELLGSQGADAKVMAKMIADISSNGGNVSAAVQQSLGKKLGDSYYQVWINGLLSSPATHVANVTSNLGTTLFSIPERYITAGFDAMRGAGGESLAAANGRAAGFFGGLLDGFKLMTGRAKNEALQVGSKLERPVDAISAAAWGKQPDSTIGKGLDYLGRAIGMPGWALEKGDTFFKGVGYRMKVQETASLMASQEGLTGKAFKERVADILANPPADIAEGAVDFARYQTFTKDAGKFAKHAQGMADAIPGGRFIMPFVRTPANILSYGFERTPVALLMGSVRTAIRNGGPEGAEAMARMAAGSMLMASVTPLVLDGKVTGAGPANPDQRRALEETGWRPYSVKIGDKYISYARMEPLSTLIGYSADIGSIMGQLEDEDSGEMVAAGLAAFSRNLTSKTFLSGITEFVDVALSNSPGRWENYAARMGAGFIQPVYSQAGRRAANYFDRTKRDYRSDDVNGFLRSTVDKAMSGVPGMGGDAPALRDVWGNEQTYFNGVAPTIEAVSPIKIVKEDKDPVNALIAKNEIPLTLPSRNVLGVKLTNEEYSRYSEMAGTMAKEKLDSLYKEGYFDNKTPGPDGSAALIVRKVLSTSREVAAKKMIREFPELQGRIYDAREEAKSKLIGR